MPEKTIIINQVPVAQPRPKITKWVTFDPAKDKKTWYKIQISEQIDELLENPVELNILFFLPIPKSTSKKRHILMNLNEIKHTKKPDIDNYIKLILDVFNGLVIKDDSQVWHLQAKKLYSDKPRTEITIRW